MPKLASEAIINGELRQGYRYGAFFVWTPPKTPRFKYRAWNVVDLSTGHTIRRGQPFAEARAAARRLNHAVGDMK